MDRIDLPPFCSGAFNRLRSVPLRALSKLLSSHCLNNPQPTLLARTRFAPASHHVILRGRTPHRGHSNNNQRYVPRVPSFDRPASWDSQAGRHLLSNQDPVAPRDWVFAPANCPPPALASCPAAPPRSPRGAPRGMDDVCAPWCSTRLRGSRRRPSLTPELWLRRVASSSRLGASGRPRDPEPGRRRRQR